MTHQNKERNMNHSWALFLLLPILDMVSRERLFDESDFETTCRNLHRGIPSRIRINVSGHIYEIYTSKSNHSRRRHDDLLEWLGILDAYPDTLLGNRERREKYRFNSQMLVFHRHPTFFSYILFYYIQGFIEKPTNIPSDIFYEECRFFSIPFLIDDDDLLILQYKDIHIDDYSFSPWFDSFSCLISILSCLILFFNDRPKSNFIVNQLFYKSILTSTLIGWMDMACFVWFMLEYYIRYLYSSNRNFHYFIDFISIAPIFFSLSVHSLSHWFPYLTIVYPFYICLKSFRVIRLIRYIPRLDLIRQTLFISLNNLSLTLTLSSLFIIFFAILLFLLERTDPSSNIIDINIALSWAVETLTTIGYGESVPSTYQGRCLAIFTCIFGLIIFALPIPTVFRRFQLLDQKSLKRNLWRKYFWFDFLVDLILKENAE